MEEFKGFNLGSVKKESKIIKTTDYVSSLGYFSWQQERIILFGRSTLFVTLNLLVLIGFLISLVFSALFLSADLTITTFYETSNFNWTKIVMVLALGFSLIIPIAITLITIGSKKADVEKMVKGLELIRLMVTIAYGLLIVSAVIIGFLMLRLLFYAFLLVIFVLAILVGLFYLYFKFLKEATEILDRTIYVLKSKSKSYQTMPKATKLIPYFIFFLVITVLNKLVNLGRPRYSIPGGNEDLVSLFNKIYIIENLSFVFGLIISIYLIILIGKFDDFIRKPQPIIKKPVSFD